MKHKVVIEIPKGTKNNKYEFDEKTQKFRLDFVFENVVWPYNYGFFPNTLAKDKDTLDAIVLSSKPLKQALEVECKIIGVMKVLDRGEQDDKIICVLKNDKQYKNIKNITDISKKQKQEWMVFIQELARQKTKLTKILGFGGTKIALNKLKIAIKQQTH